MATKSDIEKRPSVADTENGRLADVGYVPELKVSSPTYLSLRSG
jgi:hypothetical protein